MVSPAKGKTKYSLYSVLMQPAAKAQSGAENTEPQSLLKRYIEAQNAGDLDSALALWAEDGVIINTRGREDGRSVGEII